MRNLFRKFWNDERGNALMIAGACLPLIVGAAGLASDTIQWTMWKRQLQRAADSAAIAGVYDRENSAGSTANTPTAISRDLTLNNHTWMSLKSGYPQITYPSDTGVSTMQVQVVLAVQQKLPFSAIFITTPPTIIATSRAASLPAGGDACVQALETNASKTGITNSGNTAIYMPDCVMYSNSPSTNSASAGGSSSVTAQSIAAVGGIQQSNNWSVQSYRPYSPPLADPFANLNPNPADMKCSTQTLDWNTNFSSLPAGTNCFSALSIQPNKTLTLPDNFGPVFINGGNADFKGDFKCNGCTIVMTNSNASSTAIGTVSANATTLINITAPTTGTYKGVAIMQDRRSPETSNKINGGSASAIIGAIYFPSSELWYNGSGNVTATCTMIVSKRVVFTGNSGVSNKFKKLSDCGAAGLPSSSAIRMVRLVA